MKPRTTAPKKAAGLALAGLFSIGLALAGGKPMDRPHGSHGGPPMPFLSELNLSENQKNQVKSIVDDEHAKLAPLSEASRAARRALEEAIHGPVFDESAIRAAATRASGAEGDLAVERGRLASRIRGVLTPDQQKQMDTLRQQSLERMQQRLGQHHGAWGEDQADAPDEP